MDSISVGTLRRGFYVERVYKDIPATIKPEMELWTVLDLEPLYCQIGAHEEPYCLYFSTSTYGNFNEPFCNGI